MLKKKTVSCVIDATKWTRQNKYSPYISFPVSLQHQDMNRVLECALAYVLYMWCLLPMCCLCLVRKAVCFLSSCVWTHLLFVGWLVWHWITFSAHGKLESVAVSSKQITQTETQHIAQTVQTGEDTDIHLPEKQMLVFIYLFFFFVSSFSNMEMFFSGCGLSGLFFLTVNVLSDF